MIVGMSGLCAVILSLWAFDPLIVLLEQFFRPVDGSISEIRKTTIHLYLTTIGIVNFLLAGILCTCSWQKYRPLFTPYRISVALSVIVLLLASLSVSGQYQAFVLDQGTYTYLNFYFNLDGERTIPTGFSAALLFCSALLLALIGHRKHRDNAPYIKSWCFLAMGFVYLSIDEAMRIHEELFYFLIPVLENFPHSWVIPASVIMLFFVFAYIRFLLYLSPKYRFLFIVSGAIYVGGAIGIEAIGGLYAHSYGKGNFTYQIIANIEEVFEMMGIVLFIYTLHSYWIEFYNIPATTRAINSQTGNSVNSVTSDLEVYQS